MVFFISVRQNNSYFNFKEKTTQDSFKRLLQAHGASRRRGSMYWKVTRRLTGASGQARSATRPP
jgi:hypothetical protein